MEDAPPPSGTGAVREEMVANGVAFLKHPRVQAAPLSQRITFLEKKGLSQEEVAEALARVKRQGAEGSSSSNSNTTSAPLDQLYGDQPPAPTPTSYGMPHPPPYPGGGGYMHDAQPPPPPPPPPMWHQLGVMLPGAVVAGLALGAGAAHLIRLRRQQADQEEREQRMLEREFQERQRQHQRQRGRLEGEEGAQGGPMMDGPDGSFAEEPPLPLPLREEEGLVAAAAPPPVVVMPVPSMPPPADGEGQLSMKELARAIETQAAALTALAQASERSRQDLHALLTGQVAAQTADIRAELSTIKQVLLLSASASASSSSTIGGLLEGNSNGGRHLALTMAASAAAAAEGSGKEGQVEALPTPDKDGGEEGRGGGSGSAFSSPAKGEKKGEEGEEEEGESEEERAAQAVREAAEAARRHKAKVRRVCAALKGMRAQNAPEVLQEAADMLLIYVNNLIKYPTVPRFRKVALVNQGYKERVAKVQGHEEFLRSLGYAEGSACFEWGGHLAAGQEQQDNAALLHIALGLLTAVKKGEEPEWPAEAEEGNEAATAAEEEEEEEGQEGGLQLPLHQAPLGGHDDDDAPKLDEDRLHALLHPNSPRSGQPAAAGENKTDSAPATPVPTTTAAVAPQAEGDGDGGPERQEGQQQQQQQPQPQYPKSFMEIMQMAERGETPAGIQQVENRLSSDVADGRAFPSAARPAPTPVPKPWEQEREGREEGDAKGKDEGGEMGASP